MRIPEKKMDIPSQVVAVYRKDEAMTLRGNKIPTVGALEKLLLQTGKPQDAVAVAS